MKSETESKQVQVTKPINTRKSSKANKPIKNHLDSELKAQEAKLKHRIETNQKTQDLYTKHQPDALISMILSDHSAWAELYTGLTSESVDDLRRFLLTSATNKIINGNDMYPSVDDNGIVLGKWYRAKKIGTIDPLNIRLNLYRKINANEKETEENNDEASDLDVLMQKLLFKISYQATTTDNDDKVFFKDHGLENVTPWKSFGGFLMDYLNGNITESQCFAVLDYFKSRGQKYDPVALNRLQSEREDTSDGSGSSFLKKFFNSSEADDEPLGNQYEASQKRDAQIKELQDAKRYQDFAQGYDGYHLSIELTFALAEQAKISIQKHQTKKWLFI